MILKEKQFKSSADPMLKAGDEAEKQMAFYLKREFGKASDVFVINDLRIVCEGDVAQIDHLLVTQYGLFIVESKSVYGAIAFDRHGGWVRTFKAEKHGMPSPIKQAENQGKIVKGLLIANKENLLGMLLGIKQKGFHYCLFEIRVAISDNGIIEERGIEEPRVLKADMVSESIFKRLDQLKLADSLLNSLLSLKTDPPWSMKVEEAKLVAEFLVCQHRPREQENKEAPEKIPKNSVTSHFVPRTGSICPKCKQHKLERRSIKRTDDTETDYLSCAGYPNTCDAIFALVALASSANENKVAENAPPIYKPSNQESPQKHKVGDACPRCKKGEVVLRKGTPDFLACTGFANKPRCRFTAQLDRIES